MLHSNTQKGNATDTSFLRKYKVKGSLIFAVKEAGFGGVSARTRAHTPKSGYPPREFSKSQVKAIVRKIAIRYNKIVIVQQKGESHGQSD